MGILGKKESSVSEFIVEFLAGSKEVIFGPGSIIQGISQTPRIVVYEQGMLF